MTDQGPTWGEGRVGGRQERLLATPLGTRTKARAAQREGAGLGAGGKDSKQPSLVEPCGQSPFPGESNCDHRLVKLPLPPGFRLCPLCPRS